MKQEPSNIRVAFWGTAAFAVPFLHVLSQDRRFLVVAVVTRPDEPAGRRQTPTPPPVKIAAEELGLPVLQPESLKADPWMRTYEATAPDIGVVVAYGKLIPDAILKIPAHQTLNVHPSLLPRHRGPSPIQTAIADGDSETGVTVMLLDAEMDHGPILAQERVPLTGREAAPALEARLADVGSHMLPEAIVQYCTGNLDPQPQDHRAATVTKLITRDDGRVDWSKPAADTERLFRAFEPWPGLWTEWNRGGNIMRIKFLEVSVADGSGAPGTVLPNLVVACGTGGLRISRLQPEGKRAMTATEFLHGYKNAPGSRWGSL